MFDPVNLLHLLMGPFLVAVAVVFRRFPPRDINWAYGYRTARSMASQEAWEFANRYAAKGLLVIGLITTAIQLLLFLTTKPEFSILAAAGLVCVGPLLLIPVVEARLKRRFESRKAEPAG